MTSDIDDLLAEMLRPPEDKPVTDGGPQLAEGVLMQVAKGTIHGTNLVARLKAMSVTGYETSVIRMRTYAGLIHEEVVTSEYNHDLNAAKQIFKILCEQYDIR